MVDVLQIQTDASRALSEDIGSGDVTASLIPAENTARAEIISREPMLICGQLWVDEVFRQVDPGLITSWKVEEGAWLENPMVLCEITGSARHILTAERTALNFLQTMSATATQAFHYVQQLKNSNTILLDTRKTLPGLRVAQKYAVTCGGGKNHRMGLFDAFLIKENHIKACGSITAAIQLARSQARNIMVEIEVETLDELREALNMHPDRILLDNFTIEMIEEAVDINASFGCELEATGGLDRYDLKDIAKTGVQYISIGAMTKSIKAIDLSLLIREEL